MSRRKTTGKTETTATSEPQQTKTSEQDLIEQLADKEHASWARWQAYLHSLCERREDGSLVIPASRVAHWEREIATPYADLSEHEKQYDRDEVAHILPFIREFAKPATSVPVRLQIVFEHDLQPLGALTYDVAVPVPTAEGEMGQIVVQLDALEVMRRLAQALQPQQPQPKPGGILVPGPPRALPRELFRPGPSAVKLKADD